VVTDDFSRFTWTFFLKTKDESSGILRKFITEIENLKDLKVKIIRTPQQNGVAKRRNRTLIEAARTMLADAKLPVTFWAEAVNTACYVQNRVLVNKSQNKTPYELFNGDEGYFIGYSMSSKAFRVFNKRTRRVEENLHVEFLENKAIEKGAGPNCKPQDDCSTNIPESSGNSNPTATLTNPPVDQLETLTVETPIPTVSSSVLTACFTNSLEPLSDTRLISKRVANQVETPSLDNILTLTNRFEYILGVTTNSVDSDEVEADKEDGIFLSQDKYIGDILKKFRYSDVRSSNTPMDKENPWGKDGTKKDVDLHLYRSMIGSLMCLTASRPDNMFAVCACDRHQVTPKESYSDSDYGGATQDRKSTTGGCQFLGRRLISWQCKKQTIVATSKTKAEYIAAASCCGQVLWIQNQLLDYGPTPTLRIHKDHPKSQIIGSVDTLIQTRNKSKEEEGINYDEVFAPVARIEAIRLFLAYDSFMGFRVYQMDVKSAFLYGTIDEEVYLPGFQDPKFPAKVYKVEKAMYGLHQAPRAWYGDILKKFGYSDLRSLNTPMDKENPWGKDGTGKDTIMATSTTKAEYVAAASCCGQVLWIQNQLLDYGDCFEKKLISVDHIHTDENVVDLLTKPFDAGRFQYLVFYDYHNMVAILEMSKHNVDFHPIVDFVEESPLRIETMEEGTKILATVDGILRTVTESSFKRNLKLQDEEGISSLPDAELFENLTLMGYNGEGSGTPTEPHHPPSPEAQPISSTTPSSPTILSVTTASIPTVILSDTPTLRQYTRRARIAQSSALPPVADEPAYPLRDVSQGEGSMQQTLDELTALCTILQRQHSEMVSKFEAQELEINMLKARVKLLEDRKGGGAERSGDDAPIKGRNLDEGEAAVERVSDDTEEMANVLTSMDAATVLASRVAEVSTGSGSIPTAGPPAAEVPTGSDVVPTAGLIFATATMVARELEEQMVREDQRMSEQVDRDAEIARIHAEGELQIMIDGLDRSNKTVAKYLQEYHQFASELPLERRIELISDLVRYQDNYAKAHKYQSQQRKPWSKKQKRDYYIAVIKSNLGWKVKNFRGMTFEEIEAKFTIVWKQIENFIPIGSKEEAKRFKRKGIRKGLAIGMISYKLKVETYSKMANDLILKIYKIASSSRQQVMEFPLLEEVPTTSEESSHCQKKRDVTAVKITLLLKLRRNCQSKSYDSFTKGGPIALTTVPGTDLVLNNHKWDFEVQYDTTTDMSAHYSKTTFASSEQVKVLGNDTGYTIKSVQHQPGPGHPKHQPGPEETDAFLALNSIPPGIDNKIFDGEGDILLLEKLLNIDSIKDLLHQELNNDSKGDILFLGKLLEDEPLEAKKSNINSFIREPSDAFLMGDNKIKFNPLKDIEDPVPIPRVSEKPLDSLDSISKTFDMTIINPLFDFDSAFTLNLDNPIFDIKNEESDESKMETIMDEVQIHSSQSTA
nr:uncharacterized mitochondrial protein AtMg00810-like [Tanacetum cinerariifolium]